VHCIKTAMQNTTSVAHIKPAILVATAILLSACGTSNKVDPLEVDALDQLIADQPVANTDSATESSDSSGKLKIPTTLKTAELPNIEASVEEGSSEDELEPLNITLATWRAERGHLESQVALGLAYSTGTPRVEKDPAQAKLWFELASLKGDSRAQYELGKLFYTGQGADKDYFNAREWWMEAALQGNLDAQQKLGYLYSEGLGVERDFEQAKLWYKKAANSGHAEAQTLLGSLYHEGGRIPTNYDEAFKWYKLAAEQGHAHAQYTLATLFHDGLGTKVDYLQCAAWVDVAIANGFDDEYDARANCRGQLDELANRTATNLADVWKKRYLSTGI